MNIPYPALPLALNAHEVDADPMASRLPRALALAFSGRQRHRLGEPFSLGNFGVNLTRLAPGGRSSFLHAHERQDEFVFVLAGHPTLFTSEGSLVLGPGWSAGFRAVGGRAHCLVNHTDTEVWYLEVGDRTPGDRATYPEEDLQATLVDGVWQFARKDGSPL